MRASELRVEDLLEFDPSGGVLRFAGQRTLLLDAVALGLLRAQLIESFGVHAACGFLTRLGYSHGWRTAESLRHTLAWDDEHEWRIAGGRLHRLQGLVSFEPVTGAERASADSLAEAIWHDSYEAEQHLLHLGRASEPVCWSLCGFASGYLSAATGQEVYCVETQCRGSGAAVCRMVGRTREAWGQAIEPYLVYYERDCLDAALRAVRDALKQTEARLRARQRALGPEAAALETGGIVARSEGMRRVLELARRVAGVDTTVLVRGESGVGKELVARFLHEHSVRTGGPFVAVNCGALPETLLESELFGHVRGAFTGATADRPGLFEAAQGGTLFLDELGEVPPALQVRLLRVLQERQVRRVGENRERTVDVRIVAATHRDLAAEVQQGRFREDLFYRLRVVELAVPPLRERPDDILPLARVQLHDTARRFGRKVHDFTPAVARCLIQYAWPGNVRELLHAVERAVVFAESECIDVADLPPEIGRPQPAAARAMAVSGTLAEVERAHILATLEAAQGNKAEAARRLGIGTATLFRKLVQYEASPARPGRGRPR